MGQRANCGLEIVTPPLTEILSLFIDLERPIHPSTIIYILFTTIRYISHLVSFAGFYEFLTPKKQIHQDEQLLRISEPTLDNISILINKSKIIPNRYHQDGIFQIDKGFVYLRAGLDGNLAKIQRKPCENSTETLRKFKEKRINIF